MNAPWRAWSLMKGQRTEIPDEELADAYRRNLTGMFSSSFADVLLSHKENGRRKELEIVIRATYVDKLTGARVCPALPGHAISIEYGTKTALLEAAHIVQEVNLECGYLSRTEAMPAKRGRDGAIRSHIWMVI